MLRKALILSAFGLGAALAAALVVGIPKLGWFRAAPTQAIAAPPDFKGSMGEFSYFSTPRPVPPITFQDASGRTLSLADFKGKVLLVNFWATWCAPCVREMPALDRLQAALGGPDFTVLDLSVDHDGKAAVQPYFAENHLIHLGVYIDRDSQAFHAWQGQGVPTSFIIGRDGLARGELLGPAQWDSAVAIRLIQFYEQEGRPTKLQQAKAGAPSTRAN